jgi:hypothetical protein
MTVTAHQDVHLEVTEQEFERRLVARGHAPDEIHVLWEELVGAEAAPTPRVAALGLGPTIAVYLGVVLMVAALVSLLALYWETLDPWGVLVLAAVSFAGSLVVSEVLRGRGYRQPAEVLETVAVGFVPLVVYAVAEAAGWWWWFDGDLEYLPNALTAMTIATLVVAGALLVLRPTPLLLPVIGAGTALLAVDLAEVVLGNDATESERFAFVLPVGIAWLVAGLRLDVEGERWTAAWVHWVGLLIAGVSTIVLIPKTVPGFALVGVVGAIALFSSAFVRHWSYTVVGALGVFIAVTGGVSMLGSGAPIALVALAVALFVVGFRWARWRESVRAAVLARLPTRARSFLARLAP